MSEAEAPSYCALIRGPMRSYRRVDELTEFTLPVKYPRDPGYRPTEHKRDSLRSIATGILPSVGRKSRMATIFAKRSGRCEFSWPETYGVST